MSITVESLAEQFACQYRGDGSHSINSIKPISQSVDGSISFLHNEKYRHFLDSAKGCIILSPEHAESYPGPALVSENPYLLYARVANFLNKVVREVCQSIHPSAVIDSSVQLPDHISVGANCVIGKGTTLGQGSYIHAGVIIGEDCVIGDSCELFAHSTLYNNVSLGDRVVLHSGVVLGSDGFGFATEHGRWVPVPQLGGVLIGSDVSIGANTTVDSGTIDPTHIHDGVIVDNLVQIGHNVVIHEHTAIAACVGISGSTQIGRHCMLGGQTGIAGHLSICDNVVLLAKTQVTKSIKQAGVYSSIVGFQERTSWNKNVARLRRLDATLQTMTTKG